ncbi:DUF7312 domain-containing protein [Halorientalis litorea]|uniref:DUF7312 domain-containing protein n=1 Tax=Halorientalis litorea TaxID=2931977 RepID=UPI001FF49758|nr:hypothetical protein [Halorientalis litorea]
MADSEDDEWQFTLDDLDDETTDDPAAVDDGSGARERSDEHDGGDGEDGGNVAGSLTVEDGVEPGQPTAENAFFVALGFASTLLLFLSIAGLI